MAAAGVAVTQRPDRMPGEALAIIERLFKAAIFVPTMALIAWWVFAAWLDRTLDLREAAIAAALLAAAFVLGVISIVRGGWSFMSILGLVYAALLALVCWEYIYWRRRERDHLLAAVTRYREAIEKDPANAAAYSFLGRTLLKLRCFEQAAEALEHALALDPASRSDRDLLELARQGRGRPRAPRLD
jgi:tetratricopeptide (TPR) repeat protein